MVQVTRLIGTSIVALRKRRQHVFAIDVTLAAWIAIFAVMRN
jgi:hypothetical protein